MGCGLALEYEYKSLKENVMGLILLIILILILVGALPTWGYSRSWGYYPGGIVGTILIVVLILLLLGYL
jgi:uncharacterized membrane protein YdcZ (DUF606 family)